MKPIIRKGNARIMANGTIHDKQTKQEMTDIPIITINDNGAINTTKDRKQSTEKITIIENHRLIKSTEN